MNSVEIDPTGSGVRSREARPRPGGRPTKAAAAERDERLLEIATQMFMDQGFETTSMDRLAEAAAVGKATLYARYADKGALFADVLRRRILQVYGPLEEEVGTSLGRGDLESVLKRVAVQLVTMGLSESSIALGRILSAQGPRFPALAQLAVSEGYGRQVRIIETILKRFADDKRYDLADPALAADLFQSLILGPASRFKIYGLPVDLSHIEKRTEAAVRMFVRGISA